MAVIKENPPVVPTPATPEAPDAIDLTGAQAEGRDFLEQNQTLIVGIVGALIAVAAGIFLYRTFVQQPAEAAASEQMWRAQQQFDQDSFNLALLNPAPGFMGFVDIADEYGNTPAGNLANYYAGVSYLRLGQYDAAIDYLKSYDEDGEILPATKAGVLGDAYAQKGDLETAADYYEDAVDKSDDAPIVAPYYLYKLGLLRERLGDKAAANALYTRIQREYPTSQQASDIEKYILRTAS